MIEARNVFPLKALNAITIRDTADKVRIAERSSKQTTKRKRKSSSTSNCCRSISTSSATSAPSCRAWRHAAGEQYGRRKGQPGRTEPGFFFAV